MDYVWFREEKFTFALWAIIARGERFAASAPHSHCHIDKHITVNFFHLGSWLLKNILVLRKLFHKKRERLPKKTLTRK